ncbi:hypothetical protein U9M48_031969 [Paspalum notatum var. saurae]|uniref:Uncharacterized protein n=1 Tax=Paspalum notatum var. saurae TaxID=547442 RepID=A0AAQ3U3Q0_PASNO
MEKEDEMVNTRNGQHSGSEPHANGAPPPPELATLGRGQLQPWGPRNRGISYKDFEELRLPVFTKCPEPLDADDWLHTIKSKVTLLPELTEQQKVRLPDSCCKDQPARGTPRFSRCSGLGMSPPGRSLLKLSGLTISRTA